MHCRRVGISRARLRAFIFACVHALQCLRTSCRLSSSHLLLPMAQTKQKKFLTTELSEGGDVVSWVKREKEHIFCALNAAKLVFKRQSRNELWIAHCTLSTSLGFPVAKWFHFLLTKTDKMYNCSLNSISIGRIAEFFPSSPMKALTW